MAMKVERSVSGSKLTRKPKPRLSRCAWGGSGNFGNPILQTELVQFTTDALDTWPICRAGRVLSGDGYESLGELHHVSLVRIDDIQQVIDHDYARAVDPTIVPSQVSLSSAGRIMFNTSYLVTKVACRS
jgi:hypothetical protein